MKKSFRAIRLESPDEFKDLMEHLTDEAFRVRTHNEFWEALDNSFEGYEVELNQAPRFWELTRRAHEDAVIIRLGRLYDPHGGSISLGNLLQTIEDSPVVRAALLQPKDSKLDLVELDQDMSSVSAHEATVKKLLAWRNEYMAHRGSRHVRRGTFAALPVLERKEIRALLDRALDILRKYRERFGFPWVSWGRHEVQDFDALLELLRAGLRSRS
jgi:hypothetical protein